MPFMVDMFRRSQGWSYACADATAEGMIAPRKAVWSLKKAM